MAGGCLQGGRRQQGGDRCRACRRLGSAAPTAEVPTSATTRLATHPSVSADGAILVSPGYMLVRCWLAVEQENGSG